MIFIQFYLKKDGTSNQVLKIAYMFLEDPFSSPRWAISLGEVFCKAKMMQKLSIRRINVCQIDDSSMTGCFFLLWRRKANKFNRSFNTSLYKTYFTHVLMYTRYQYYHFLASHSTLFTNIYLNCSVTFWPVNPLSSQKLCNQSTHISLFPSISQQIRFFAHFNGKIT